jgi:quinol monooxygenase YgiN
MSAPIAVIVVYRFKPSVSDDAIRALLVEHRSTLRAERLVTEREPWVLRSRVDRCEFVEVFEWRDEAAGRSAQANPRVQAVWGKFAAQCETVGLSLGKTAEAQHPFAHFESWST